MKQFYFFIGVIILSFVFPFFGYGQDHLLLQEFCVAPTDFEYIAIYNPFSYSVDLSNYYISDNNAYYGVTTGTQVIPSSDFLLRFPSNAVIASGSTQYISLGAKTFSASFGLYPDYEFGTSSSDTSFLVPDMRMPAPSNASSISGLTNTSEMIILFYWDGVSNLVQDVDYVAYGTTISNFVDKSGISVNGSSYSNDTPINSQSPIAAPASGYIAQRSLSMNEGSETLLSGNGLTGHDETSEAFSITFTITNKANLPVELVSFAAQRIQDGIKLQWMTATEINSYGFDVERRTIGQSDWSKICFIPGHGTTNIQHTYSSFDTTVSTEKYAYRLKQMDNDGSFTYSKCTEVDNILLPKACSLAQNFPNPFNPSTRISFDLPFQSFVSLKVFDVTGREVAAIVSEEMSAGRYTKQWNAAYLPSGVYFYRLQAGSFRETKKLILLK
jgi:hypothetical protein